MTLLRSALREVEGMFARCNFHVLPITDDDKILSVVTYRDVIGLKHRFVE